MAPRMQERTTLRVRFCLFGLRSEQKQLRSDIADRLKHTIDIDVEIAMGRR
jgi:hypothetical protein